MLRVVHCCDTCIRTFTQEMKKRGWESGLKEEEEQHEKGTEGGEIVRVEVLQEKNIFVIKKNFY